MEYLKSSGKRCEPGYITRDEDGNIVMRVGRQSIIQSGIKIFYKDYGRAPRKSEYEEIAVDHLRHGFADVTMEVPPNEDYLQMEGMKNALEEIERKIATGMEEGLSGQRLKEAGRSDETVNFQLKEKRKK